MLSSISEATNVEGRTSYLIEDEYSLNATRTCSYYYEERENTFHGKTSSFLRRFAAFANSCYEQLDFDCLC